ncbi:ABC transporter permease subunit [Rugamonas sp. FT82W]|uniref:ABC transporter permease subunit n=1 Tax=Duganella vulcania TaxID=2692166 RepID=A0A845G1L2_9BURK|nr:ABC transporter permease [Duganella vulcania]MYM87352.1 ABC transporter permease subunit [Duganella vulcania]
MTAIVHNTSPGLWRLAWRRLRADRVAMASLAVVAAFLLMLVLSASGLIVADWEREVGVNYAPPGFVGAEPAVQAAPAQAAQALPDNPFDPLADDIRALRAQLAAGGEGAIDMYGVTDPLAADLAQLRGARGDTAAAHAGAGRLATLPFGADKWGHDIIKKTIKGGETSIVVGLVAALLAVGLGSLFGALSGYFGGVVDDLFNWFYSIFTAIPSVLMILAVAAVLQQKGVATIVLILGLTGWTGPYRLIRAEYIKHKAREYVLAADAIGASHWRRMFVHIFPNVSHVALVQMSILVVGFIKAEVILSFLGFGVPVGVVSWGSMLNEAQNELILGRWWQLTAAAIAMALLVTAFSLFTDALRDALDPKVK